MTAHRPRPTVRYVKRALFLIPALALAACGSSGPLDSKDVCQVAFVHAESLPKTVQNYQDGIVDRTTTAADLARLHDQLSGNASVAKADVRVPIAELGDQAGRASVALGGGDDSQLQPLVPRFNAAVDACKRAGFTP